MEAGESNNFENSVEFDIQDNKAMSKTVLILPFDDAEEEMLWDDIARQK